MNIRPFHFKLSKVSAKEQRALEALFEYLPRTGMQEKLRDAVLETLISHLNVNDISYRIESVFQDRYAAFCQKIPEQPVVVVLGTMPREGKIFVEIDSNLAGFIVERLLGGGAESLPEPKQLSEIEQGVLQYLLLQLLSHVYRLSGQDARVHFRFEKFCFDSRDLKDLANAETQVFILNVRLTAGTNSGFLRLVFPSPIVEQLYLGVEAKGESRETEKENLIKRLSEFGHIRFSLWADGGKVSISARDLKNLEVGDVVVLDQTQLKLGEKGLEGAVVLRAGDGGHGGFVSDVSADVKKIHCRIKDIQKGEDIL